MLFEIPDPAADGNDHLHGPESIRSIIGRIDRRGKLKNGRDRHRPIANRLCISEDKVKVPLHNISEKVKADGWAALLRYVQEKGVE